MNTFLKDLALAHQHHEGYFPGSVAFINNNPGNIRAKDGHFIHFSTYGAGLEALEGDLKVKIFGTATSVQHYMLKTGKSYEQLTMQDYVSIYAPSADHNDPINYCNALCTTLAAYHLHPGTYLSVLRSLILGVFDVAPDPPSPTLSLDQRLASAQNALKFKPSIERTNMLRRLIARIQNILSQPSR